MATHLMRFMYENLLGGLACIRDRFHTHFMVWVMLIIEDHTGKYRPFIYIHILSY